MSAIEKVTSSNRRTVGMQRASRSKVHFPHKRVKIAHACERPVWTRFLATFDSSMVCTDEWIERTEEVAFYEVWREVKARNKKAHAAYLIEWLYDGRFYVSVEIEYSTGDYCGVHTHEIFQTRQECVDYFLALSRRHFGGDRNMPELQHEARQQMQELLAPTLFGFIEPEPVR